MKKFLLLISALVGIQATSLAQQVIEGEVRDAESKEIIAGASIRIVGTQKGTYTSGSGKFRLPLPEGKNVLKVSSVGFKEKQVTVGADDKSIVITLSPSVMTTGGITVTAELFPFSA